MRLLISMRLLIPMVVFISAGSSGCSSNTPALPPGGFDLAWQPGDSAPGIPDGGGRDGQAVPTDGSGQEGTPAPDSKLADGQPPSDAISKDGTTTDVVVVDALVKDGAGDTSPSDGAADSLASDTSPSDAAPADTLANDTLANDTLANDTLANDTAPPPLVPTFSGQFHEVAMGSLFDIRTLVAGGATPLMCTFYIGPGLGTAPAVTTLSNCMLAPVASPGDLPGLYGFIVIVGDQAGQQVEIPIVVRNGSCSSAAATISPPEHPVRVVPQGSAFDWDWQLAKVDTPCTNVQCTTCSGCVQYQLLTKDPLTLANMLDCGNTGDACINAAGLPPATSCPAIVPWNAKVRVRTHAPLRSDGGPAWATVEFSADYSGAKLAPTCGDKSWGCHIEVFEQ